MVVWNFLGKRGTVWDLGSTCSKTWVKQGRSVNAIHMVLLRDAVSKRHPTQMPQGYMPVGQMHRGNIPWKTAIPSYTVLCITGKEHLEFLLSFWSVPERHQACFVSPLLDMEHLDHSSSLIFVRYRGITVSLYEVLLWWVGGVTWPDQPPEKCDLKPVSDHYRYNNAHP